MGKTYKDRGDREPKPDHRNAMQPDRQVKQAWHLRGWAGAPPERST